MPKRISRLLTWGTIILAAAVLLVTVGNNSVHSQQPPDSGKQAPASEPRTGRQGGAHTVGLQDLSHSILITGELVAARSRDLNVPNIRSGFASTVTFLAEEGSLVGQGERILEFDASGLLSQKSEAERRLDEAELKIQKTKTDLESQRTDFLTEVSQAEGNLKIAELYGKIGKELLPANTYQKYQLDLEKATLALTKAKERLANHEASIPAQMSLVELERAQAELDLKKIEGDLALLQVDAPQDGIVIYGDNWASNRKIQVGDNLFPGMTVVTLPDLSSMQVIGYVYDTELRFLSKGMRCELSLDSVPGKRWEGRIESLTSVAGRKGFASQHKVFRAVIQPEGIDLAVMKPGMTVRVEVPVSLMSQTLAIPREYLGLDAMGRYFVLKGQNPQSASIQFVEVGLFTDRLVQITSGLAAGEAILEPGAGTKGEE